MAAHTIMIQGTSSSVGKSLLVTALCRIFRQDGWRVAPFKSQNMSNNSYITQDGLEIGRAQGVQAEAAGVPATADMNPVLLKPSTDSASQVVIHGRPRGDMDFRVYQEEGHEAAASAIRESLERLRKAYEILVIEGAGSPAEVNLNDRELVNMRIAAWADAPVLLAADIDQGGALAALVGTLELLNPEDRDRVAGLIINKFRGDLGLLEPALEFLEKRTGKPVVGVVPYLPIDLEAEDAHSLYMQGAGSPEEDAQLTICAVHLPYISNFTDLDPLRRAPGVRVVWVQHPAQLQGADAVVIPGTKNTAADLRWLWQTGLGAAIQRLAERGVPVVGICGGYQMLGARVLDPHGYESSYPETPGLGLLDAETEFGPAAEKLTVLAEAELLPVPGPLQAQTGAVIRGYEIHAGHTRLGAGARPLVRHLERGEVLGAADDAGQVWGCYLHDLFQNEGLRRAWLTWLWQRRGLVPPASGGGDDAGRDAVYDQLAGAVRAALDMERIYRIMGLEPRR